MTNYMNRRRFHEKLTLRQVKFFSIFFRITETDEKKESHFGHGHVLNVFSCFLWATAIRTAKEAIKQIKGVTETSQRDYK